MDHVDKIIEQWHRERSDLNVTSMATIGRVKRLHAIFSRAMEKNFNAFGLHSASFDVLATLRRSGKPYALSPGDLINASMVTSGTMTNRLDQLEKAQLITRTPSQSDRRSMQITLSNQGLELIDQVLDQHVKTQDALTDCLSEEDQRVLNTIMRKMLEHFEDR